MKLEITITESELKRYFGVKNLTEKEIKHLLKFTKKQEKLLKPYIWDLLKDEFNREE